MDWGGGQVQEWGVFFVVGAMFWLLSRLCGVVPAGAFFTRSLLVDLGYKLVAPVYGFITVVALIPILGVLGYGDADALALRAAQGVEPLNTLPLWQQACLLLLVTDILQYWMHRLLHLHPLWPFHAVHHAPTVLEWHHTMRFHPVNQLLYAVLVNLVVLLMGFSPQAFVLLAPFNLVYGAMVHANLDWSFGMLRYVFASPVFHRWHHAADAHAYNKNFAPTFALLDVVFGTFYMPVGRKPVHVGAEGYALPENMVDQFFAPFYRLWPARSKRD